MYKKCEEILNKLQCEGKIKISNFIFPPKQELKLKLKDMLEDEVDEKYYLSEEITKTFEFKKAIKENSMVDLSQMRREGTARVYEDVSCTLNSRNYKEPRCVVKNTNVIGNLQMNKWQDNMKRIYDTNSYAPTINTMQGGNLEPKILTVRGATDDTTRTSNNEIADGEQIERI